MGLKLTLNLRRFLMVVVAILALGSGVAYGQGHVSGTIFDSDGKTPLAGATVLVKGTNVGAVTDANGNYTVKAASGQTLVYQCLGYVNKEIAVSNQTVLNVTLEGDTAQIEGVVVTALGLTRSEKSLGYAVAKVDNEALTQTVSNNWINNLNGKVAGLAMTGSGGASGSMRVTLRGDASLNWGKNEALFVVDGVPVLSGYTSTTGNTSYANGDAPVDFGNGVTDINPDDIETLSVLKGPSATALYGSRAANGAIVITTKKGRTDKGWGVTYNGSVSFEDATRFPDFQTEYGPSAVTTSLTNTLASAWGLPASMTDDGVAVKRQISRYAYGEKFDSSKMRYLYQSKNWETGEFTKVPWVYADDWYTGLFRTGVTYNNSVSVEGSNGEGTSGRFSVTDSRNDWIMPNSGYETQTFALNFNQRLNKHIDLSAKVNYVRKSSDNMPVASYDESSPMYGLIWSYNAYPMSNWRDEYMLGRYTKENYQAGESQYTADPYNVTTSLVYNSDSGHNPYRVLYEELNTLVRNRVFGNVQLNVHILEGLDLSLRGGMDMNNDFRTQQKPKMSGDFYEGMYREQTLSEYEFNTDFLLKYERAFICDRLTTSFAVGGNAMNWRRTAATVTAPQLNLEGPGMYKLANSAIALVGAGSRYEKAVQSLYGFVNIGWDDTYFVDITARNDWSSTLSPSNWSYFYPSVSVSALLDKTFNINSKNVNMLKLRASWANVGNDTDPYQLYDTYSSTNLDSGYRIPGTIKDPMIKPENVESYEIGLETKFFQNRLGLDVAVYENITTNQIVSASMSYEIGATSLKMNAGEVNNRGIEVSMRVVPIRTKDWNWEINANWTRFSTRLISLTDEWDPATPLQTSTGSTVGGRTLIYSYVGQEMQQIYGKSWNRAPEGSYYTDANGNQIDCSGQLLVNATTGYPQLSSQANQHIGKVNPDWRGGFGTTVRYKNLSLTANFTAQMGGHAFSVTNFALSYQGKLNNSVEGRYDGLVVEGVNASTAADGTVTYKQNSTVTENVSVYYNAYKWVRDNTEENTFSTDFLKLKELRLDYRFPATLMRKTKVLQGASVGVFAQNLFCISPWPQYDPESATQMNGANIMSGIESCTFPMTRSVGFNLKLQF